MDNLTRQRRSWNMSRIRSSNTKPELIVRSLLHRMGYRFRLRSKDLPAKPDVVLAKYRTALFVHGCFWHRHAGCKFAYTPKSRLEFWETKFNANMARDKKVEKVLLEIGWDPFVIWECELADLESVREKIDAYFKSRARKV